LTLFICGAFYFLLDFRYSSIITQKDVIIAEKDTQITGFRDRVSEYQQKLKVQNPDQAVDEMKILKEQLEETKEKLAGVINPPRDINGLYLRGQKIGVANNYTMDGTGQYITFDGISIGMEIDGTLNIEFRDLVMSYIASLATTSMGNGVTSNYTYRGAKFSIVGHRK
jgi:hypothetical protein